MAGQCDCPYHGVSDPRQHWAVCSWVRWLRERNLFREQVDGYQRMQP